MEVEGEPAPLSVMTPAPLPPARDPDDPSVVSTWGSPTESSVAGRSASSGRRILIASLILCLALGLGILLFALQPEPQGAFGLPPFRWLPDVEVSRARAPIALPESGFRVAEDSITPTGNID